jgi:hypothetical protein
MYSFGAQFAEVRVDADLGQIRVSRMVGAFGAGTILNAKTARSRGLSHDLESVHRRLDPFQTQIHFELGSMMRCVREHGESDLASVGLLAALPVHFIAGSKAIRGNVWKHVDYVIERFADKSKNFRLVIRRLGFHIRLLSTDLLEPKGDRVGEVDHHSAEGHLFRCGLKGVILRWHFFGDG